MSTKFMLDTPGPLVPAFDKLRKEEPDPDHVSAVTQQAILFLGNTKILKQLNPEVQSLAKDMISLSLHPTY